MANGLEHIQNNKDERAGACHSNDLLPSTLTILSSFNNSRQVKQLLVWEKIRTLEAIALVVQKISLMVISKTDIQHFSKSLNKNIQKYIFTLYIKKLEIQIFIGVCNPIHDRIFLTTIFTIPIACTIIHMQGKHTETRNNIYITITKTVTSITHLYLGSLILDAAWYGGERGELVCGNL